MLESKWQAKLPGCQHIGNASSISNHAYVDQTLAANVYSRHVQHRRTNCVLMVTSRLWCTGIYAFKQHLQHCDAAAVAVQPAMHVQIRRKFAELQLLTWLLTHAHVV